MATFTWTGNSGPYDTASDWTLAGEPSTVAPGSLDVAVLAGTAPYVVTIAPPQGSSGVVIAQSVTFSDPNATLSLGRVVAAVVGAMTLDGTLQLAGSGSVGGVSASTLVNAGSILSDGHGAYGDALTANILNKGFIGVVGDALNMGEFGVTNSGTIAVSDAGTVAIIGTYDNYGLISLAGGSVLDLSFGGQDANAVNQPNPVIAGTIDFLDGAGSKLITGGIQGNGQDTPTFLSTVAGFRPGDTIDLLNAVTFDSTEIAGLVNGDLIVSDQGATLVAIPVAGVAATGTLTVASDGHGYAAITMTSTPPTACFAAGSRIATARGAVAVERLRVGDEVLDPDGKAHPAIWLGHRRVDCRRHPRPHDVWPIGVRAGAFGAGVPRRDLFLSPDHAVFVDGVLIPVRYLVNGRTIAQIPRAHVTYWHVELPQHGVLLAEGLPAESYLDTGNRAAFADNGPAVQLHPDFARRVWQVKGCAPLVLDGAALHTVRARLLDRAETLGHRRTRDAALQVVTGDHVLAAEGTDNMRRVRLPPGTRRVRLLSRSGVPAQMHHDSPDHRQLGIAVNSIRIDGEQIPLADGRLGAGWHDVECTAGVPTWRWTDGNAQLALPRDASLLEIGVAMTMLSWEGSPAPRRRRAA